MNSRTGFKYLTFLLILLLTGCKDKEPELHSPEYEYDSFQLSDPELEISLIASEPDINSPVDMAWGPDGSLYVLEMTGYPVTPDKGAIKKLTDQDGDGFYTLEAIFTSDLNFPAGIMYYRGGLLVADAPNLLFLKDTNSDGKADIREVVLTGFDEGNQQYRANSLQWGLDNWIYGSGGRGGGDLSFTPDSSSVSIFGRDFRLRPEVKKVEPISGMSQFGLTHDNSGNRFISYNHRFARQVMLQEEHLLRNPSLTTKAVFDTSRNEHDRRVWTLLTETLRFNQDPIGYFTSLSGLTFYGGDLLGPEYDNSFFAGESVQAAVIRRKMKADGPSFLAYDMEDEAEFLSATDDWFHPVNFSNGPDGAFYIVDFYRKFVEHPEWAHDDKSEGINWNIGEKHGRIWRIARKTDPLDTDRMKPGFDQIDDISLVNQLKDKAVWRRRMAQQLLVNGKMTAAKEELEALLNSDNRHAKIHALWTLDGLGLLEVIQIRKTLTDPDKEVVLQGIKLFEKHSSMHANLIELICEIAVSDHSASRYHAILALGNSEGKDVKQTLIRAASEFKDKWTRLALLASLAGRTEKFVEDIMAEPSITNFCDEASFEFYRELGSLVAYKTNVENHIFKYWLDESSGDNCPKWAFLLGFMKTTDAIGEKPGHLTSSVFNMAFRHIEDSDNQALIENSIELIRYSNSESDWNRLLKIVLETDNAEIRNSGIKTLSHLNNHRISKSLFNRIGELDPDSRKLLISNSQNSMAASSVLLDALDEGKIASSEIPEELRYALLNHSDVSLRLRSEELLAASVSSDRDSIIDKYTLALPEFEADPLNGAAIFKANCTVCHSMMGEGGELGPDLTNIGNRSDEILLTSILDPGRMVSYELKLHVVTTSSGKTYSGTLAAETESSLTIKQPDGQEHTILKSIVREHKELNQSIMPEGYERIIDEKAMADLIEYLKNPGQ